SDDDGGQPAWLAREAPFVWFVLERASVETTESLSHMRSEGRPAPRVQSWGPYLQPTERYRGVRGVHPKQLPLCVDQPIAGEGSKHWYPARSRTKLAAERVSCEIGRSISWSPRRTNPALQATRS